MRIAAFLRTILLAQALLLLPVAAWAQSQTLSIEQNTSQLLRLSAPAATLVIGKPSIANVTLENEQLLLLHGVSPGTTNLIALDAKDRVIFSADIDVIVPQPQKEYMFLHRGAVTGIYDCRTARCVPSEGADASTGSLLEQLVTGDLVDGVGGN